jgi:N utilization substance protein B
VEPQPPLNVRRRRRARALALQTLYEADVSGHPPADVLQRHAQELALDPGVVQQAGRLVAGIVRHRAEIDDQIRRYAPAWPLGQLPAVDRNVLRMGIFEAVYDSTTIPVGVAINEAVELAKLYGSENSSRFVNGVLGRVVAERPPGREADPDNS